MPKRPSTARAEHEPSRKSSPDGLLIFPIAARVKNPAAVALGKLGGSKGGKARAAKLSPEARKLIAQQAAKARWDKALNLQ